MASNLLVMASDGFQPTTDGLKPTSNGLRNTDKADTHSTVVDTVLTLCKHTNVILSTWKLFSQISCVESGRFSAYIMCIYVRLML